MMRQYHPSGLHQPARLAKSGRPEGVLNVGDFARINGRVHMIEAFLPRLIWNACRTISPSGAAGTNWEPRYIARGMFELLVRDLKSGQTMVISDAGPLAEYRRDETVMPRQGSRLQRRKT